MFESQVLDFIIPTKADCQSLNQIKTSDSSISRGGVCERGSLDQQSKGRWKLESDNDSEACKDRVFMMKRQRVGEKTKTEDSEAEDYVNIQGGVC